MDPTDGCNNALAGCLGGRDTPRSAGIDHHTRPIPGARFNGRSACGCGPAADGVGDRRAERGRS
jgi:hypothetical protein